jgi:hypothetical protein
MIRVLMVEPADSLTDPRLVQLGVHVSEKNMVKITDKD